MKNSRWVALASLALAQVWIATSTYAADETIPVGRALMERLADRPRRTFLPIEWRNNDWLVAPWGQVRLAYENVQNDNTNSSSAPIGRNDGFILDNARLGLDLHYKEDLAMLISMEAASDIQDDTNTPIGEIDVRLRDAYVRWDPFWFGGIQAGQFKAPYAAEDLRSTADLLFASRAVGWEGVLVGRGYEEPGISLDRQLGVMLSTREPLQAGDFSFFYYFMVGNGNGTNQLLNDNSKLAIIGRAEVMYSTYATLGGAGFSNDRTSGDPANRAKEDDLGGAVDLLVNPGAFEFFGQFAQVDTDSETTGVPTRERRAWHVQTGYRFDTPWQFHVTPAYRFAQYDPWANAKSSAADQDARRLDYHTLGLRFGHMQLPLSLFVNYTFTEEQEPRELHNNRLQILTQVIF